MTSFSVKEAVAAIAAWLRNQVKKALVFKAIIVLIFSSVFFRLFHYSHHHSPSNSFINTPAEVTIGGEQAMGYDVCAKTTNTAPPQVFTVAAADSSTLRSDTSSCWWMKMRGLKQINLPTMLGLVQTDCPPHASCGGATDKLIF